MSARALPIAAVLVVLVVAAGCPVFTTLVPCASELDCDDGQLCDDDGFCVTPGDDGRDGDDAGARTDAGARRDAGTSPTGDAGTTGDSGSTIGDAGGPPRDAGAPAPDAGSDAGVAVADAGPVPRYRIDVTAQDAVPAGGVYVFRAALASLGVAGPLGLRATDGGPVPFVVEPTSSTTAAQTDLWFRVPIAIAASQTVSFFLSAQPGHAGPAALLDEVFPAGDAFDDGAISQTLSTSTDDCTIAESGGQLIVDMDEEGDACTVYTTTPLRRAEGFVLRHRVRVDALGDSFDPSGGYVRLLSLYEGAPPAATQDVFAYDREVLTIGAGEGGIYVMVQDQNDTYFDWNGTLFVDAQAWAAPAQSGDFEVAIDSDGVAVSVSVFDTSGARIVYTTAALWSTISWQSDDLYAFWGDRTAGPGNPYYWGDLASDLVTQRPRVRMEPTIVVTLEP